MSHKKAPNPVQLAASQAIDAGYGKFNGGIHCCIDIPDGHYTISCLLSDGRQVTFAFVPYKDGGRAQCIDIHDGNACGPESKQSMIAFDGGSDAWRGECTLATLLLKD